jgi:hypothetical protein
MDHGTDNLRRLLLALAASTLSCRTTAPFVGPIDLPPTPSASATPQGSAATSLAPITDAGSTPLPTTAASASPSADLLTCDEQHTRFASFLRNQRKRTDLVRECFRQLPADTKATSGTISAFINPDGTLLTVRSQVSPYSSTFVSCLELRARIWLRQHPGCAGGNQRVRFAVDARSVER